MANTKRCKKFTVSETNAQGNKPTCYPSYSHQPTHVMIIQKTSCHPLACIDQFLGCSRVRYLDTRILVSSCFLTCVVHDHRLSRPGEGLPCVTCKVNTKYLLRHNPGIGKKVLQTLQMVILTISGLNGLNVNSHCAKVNETSKVGQKKWRDWRDLEDVNKRD